MCHLNNSPEIDHEEKGTHQINAGKILGVSTSYIFPSFSLSSIPFLILHDILFLFMVVISSSLSFRPIQNVASMDKEEDVTRMNKTRI